MTIMKTIDFLNANKDACEGGATYALQYETMADAWDHCDRVDWMIWILKRVDKSPGKNEMRLFNCWCARATPIGDGRTTWDLLTDPRSRAAIEVAERFAIGKSSKKSLRLLMPTPQTPKTPQTPQLMPPTAPHLTPQILRHGPPPPMLLIQLLMHQTEPPAPHLPPPAPHLTPLAPAVFKRTACVRCSATRL